MLLLNLACLNPAAVPYEVLTPAPIRCDAPERREEQPYDPVIDLDYFGKTGDQHAGGIGVSDLDGDGWLDIYVPNHDADVLISKSPATDWTVTAIANPVDSENVSFLDIDLDGDLDVFTGGNNRSTVMIQEEPGIYRVSTQTGLERTGALSTSSVWGDLDGDGDLDLFESTYYLLEPDLEKIARGQAHPADANRLYLANGDGTFTDASSRLPPEALHVPTYVAGIVDVDLDGDQDLYLVNDFGAWVQPNTLLLNDGSGHFVVQAGSGADVAINGMGLGIGDINEDQIPDFLSTGTDQLTLAESVPGAGWADTALARGLTPSAGDDRHVGWSCLLEDFDNDSRLDAFVAYGHLQLGPPDENSAATTDDREDDFETYFGSENPDAQPDALFLQQEDGSFEQVAETWGIANPDATRGAVAADLNHDGWLDLVTRAVGKGPAINLSRCGENRWLEISLLGELPNPSGIGARIEVDLGDRTLSRWIHAGGIGVASSGPPSAHFGLGASEEVDALRVYWPDGTVNVLGRIKSNQFLKIHQIQ